MPRQVPPLRIATRLQTILAAVKQKMAADGIADPSLIFLSLASDEETVARAPADYFVKIWPEEESVWQPAVTGGGDTTLYIEATWVITLFLRYSVDVDFADDAYLLDANNGLYARRDELRESLQLFDPEDADGNLLMVQPMRLRYDRPRKNKPIGGWGTLPSVFEVHFTHAVEP